MHETAIKALIRRRDGHRCIECKMPSHRHIKRFGRDLEVHRVVPGSAYSLDDGVCVTLCIPCHAPKPRRKRDTVHNFATVRRHYIEPCEVLAERLGLKFAELVNILVREGLERNELWPPKQS